MANKIHQDQNFQRKQGGGAFVSTKEKFPRILEVGSHCDGFYSRHANLEGEQKCYMGDCGSANQITSDKRSTIIGLFLFTIYMLEVPSLY